MSKFEGLFLAVNKGYFRMGLKSIDLFIISQIEEFERNECKCFITNRQFSDMFGESESTVKRSLDKLEEWNIIHRETFFVKGNGRANLQRVLSVNNQSEWKVHNEPSEEKKEGSNDRNGRFVNDKWKVHNEPIKNNIIENVKENLSNADAEKRKSFSKKGIGKLRSLEELNLEELRSIKEDFEKRIDYKATRERLRLNRQVTKEMQKEVSELIKQKEMEIQNGKIEAQLSQISDEDITYISEFLRCDKNKVSGALCNLGVDAKYMLKWIPKYGETTQCVADSEDYADYRKDNGYTDDYFEIVEMMIQNNRLMDPIDEVLKFQ